MDKQPKGIQSVEIAFSIIDGLVSARQPLALGEIADILDMPKSKLHKYLVSFVRLGVLRQGPENSRYSLGPKLLESGLAILRNTDLLSLCEPELYTLRNQSQQAAALALWMPRGPMIVRYLRSHSPISIDMQIGFYAPVTASAVGRCFAAHLPEQAYLHLALAESGGTGLEPAFLAQLRNVRSEGYAVRDTPTADIPGSRAIACPVFQGTGKIVASILLIGFEDPEAPFPNSDMIDFLKDRARRISANLGFTY